MIIDMVLVYASGRGGVETVLTLMSNELKKRGYRIRIIQLFNTEYKEWEKSLDEFYVLNDDKYDIKSISNLTVEDIIDEYSEFIRKNGKPDVVVATHVPLMSYVCYKVLHNMNLSEQVPLLSWLHNSFRCFGEDSGKYVQFADASLAISKGVAAEVANSVHDRPIYLIDNPLEIDNEFIDRDTEKLNIIYVGRLASEKNLETTLKALTYLQGDWEFNVYGDGDKRENLVHMAEELNLEDKIIWHGWSNTPWENIKSASIIILSSIFEGCPMCLIEALSRGIPVVSSNNVGSLNIVEEGINGYFFDIGDYRRFAEILNDIQSSKITLPSQEACRKSVEKFSVNNVVNKFEASMLSEYNKKNHSYPEREKEKIYMILNNIKNDEDLEKSLSMLNNLNEDELKMFMLQNNLLDFVVVLNKAAIINYNMQNYEYVIPYLEIAYEMDNKNSETLYNLSVVLYNMGEFKKSLEYLQCINSKDSEVLELENILKEKISYV